MSTRANIIIVDAFDSLIFYRHSDGYPEEVMPSLERFLNLVKEGKIRDNAQQAAGWLILLGAEEYRTSLNTIGIDTLNGWKVGAYEPTTALHGDIDHVYVVDLEKKEIIVDDYNHPAVKKWDTE